MKRVIFPQINIQEYFPSNMLRQMLIKVLKKLNKHLNIARVFYFKEHRRDEMVEYLFGIVFRMD